MPADEKNNMELISDKEIGDIRKNDIRYKAVIAAIGAIFVSQLLFIVFFSGPMAIETIKSMDGAPPKIDRLVQWAKLNGNADGKITLSKTEDEDIWRARIGNESFIVLNDGASVVLENGEIINFNLSSAYDVAEMSGPNKTSSELNDLRDRLNSRAQIEDRLAASMNREVSAPAPVQQQISVPQEDGPVVRKLGFDGDGNALSPEQLRTQVKQVFGNIVKKSDWMVKYPAKGQVRDEIVVFSDPTCGYCRKLHKAIPMLNENGISVNYMFYPRALNNGADDPAAQRVLQSMSNAWCSKDPASALDKIYDGKSIGPQDCAANGRPEFPGFEHFVLGNVLNISGTPMTLNSEGRTVSGFSNIAAYMNNISTN